VSAARGTRRPHPTRVYKHGRKPSRSKSKGCALIAFAFLALPAIVLVVIR